MKQLLIGLIASLGRGHGWFRLLSAAVFLVVTLLAYYFLHAEKASGVVQVAGYYFTLITFIGFLSYLVFAVRTVTWGRLQWKGLWLAGLSVFFGAWILFIHGEFDYKIAMDDYLLAGTAKNIHESREVALTVYGRYIGSSFVPIEQVVDKRPWFYPFLVASLHDLIGYRQINPFVVNAGLSVLFLAGVYAFGHLLAGRSAAVLSVLLWSSLPLLAQNATGAGMEMLNLLMIQVVALLAVFYLKKPDFNLEGALSLGAVLLTYTRYESGLFIIPVAVVIIIGWLRERRILLSWGTVLAAPLLLGVALQTAIYAVTKSSWEMMPGSSEPFSFDNLLTNLPHALNFFFDGNAELANSLLLSVLGLPALIAFFVLARREFAIYWGKHPAGLVTLLLGGFLLIHLGIVMSFHASQLDLPFVSRYALPIHWILVFSLIAVLGSLCARWPKVWWLFGVMTLLFIVASTLPKNARRAFSKKNFIVREYNWLETLSENVFEPRSLVVDQYSAYWALNDWPVLFPEVVLMSAESVSDELLSPSGKYPSGYLVDRMHYERGMYRSNLPVVSELHGILELECIAERSFRPLELTRVYRLSGARVSD